MSRKLKPKIVLLLIDIVIFYLSLTLAAISVRSFNGFIYHIYHPFVLDIKHMLYILWIPIIWLFFMLYEDIYELNTPPPEKFKRLMMANITSFIIVFFIVGVGKLSSEISRLMVIVLFLYLMLFSMFIKPLIESILVKLDILSNNTIIVGLDDTAIKIAQSIVGKSLPNYRLLFFIDKNSAKEKIKIDTKEFEVKKIEDLENVILNNKDIDTIIVSQGAFDKNEIDSITLKINAFPKEIIIVPKLKAWNVLNLEHIPVCTLDVFLLKSKNNLNSSLARMLKRTIDYLMVLLLSPILIILMPLIAILIKLDSEGPVFFTQEREGQKGQTIRVYKFRTMYKDAEQRLKILLESDQELRKEWETIRKLTNDPRITRIGKFLRKTSLDELPQIFNVIKGEMSIVGPRPVTKEEIQKYYKDFARFYYEVKPGITGYWQISGRNEIDYSKRVLMDTFYVLNWSFWLDIYIIFRTIFVVLARKGAY